MSEYPEHEKLRAIQPFSQKIGEFVDWLQEEKALQITPIDEGHFDKDDDYVYHVAPSLISLLAEFFDIDQAGLEAEKLDMLNKQRQLNEQVRRNREE